MDASRSDAYYLAQLFERLTHLEKDLTAKLSPEAELIQRTQGLLKDLQHLLYQSDELALDILEYSLLPRVNRLLLDARQQLKLTFHARKAGTQVSKATRREQLIKERLEGPPQHPHPPAYTPLPTPLRDAERCALIEDALGRLKMLLSEP
jgi:hypothetical protein